MINLNNKKFMSLTLSFLFVSIIFSGFAFADPTITVNNLTTNDQSPELTGTFNLDTQTLTSISLSVGGQNFLDSDIVRDAAAGTWSLPDNKITTLSEGDYDVSVQLNTNLATVTDGTDNELKIDLASPTIASVSLGSDEYINSSESSSGIDISVSTTGVEDDQIVTCSLTDSETTTIDNLTGSITSNTTTISTGDISSLNDGTITASCEVDDLAGNSATTVTDTATKDTVLPVINGVTSDATTSGVLKIGDSIIFTVDISSTTAEAGLVISPITYNGGDLSWSTGDSGETYTATYTVESGQTDQDPALQLAGVTATDTAGNESSSVDGSDVVKTIDANPPSGYGVSFDGSYVNDSNQTAVSFTISNAEVGSTYNYTISAGSIDVTGSDTISSVEEQITGINVSTLADESLTLTLSLTDTASNTGSDVTDTITKDTVSPVIAEVTSDATTSGILKIGDTITFTVDISTDTAESSLVISPTTYNGGDLSWSTGDSGETYTATYTVESGQTDQDPALQLAGVTATDTAGNESSSVDGSDVIKTIDANPPSGYGVSFDGSYVNDSNQTAVSFTISNAEVGSTYNYTISAGSIDVTGSDTISSVEEQITGINVSTLADESLTLTLSLTDTASNTGSDVIDNITKDTVSPVSTGTITGTSGDNGWYISNVAYTITESDALSGISSTLYCTDSVDSCTPETEYSSSITLSAEGNNYVRFFSIDNAGNEQSVQSSSLIKIDTILPTFDIGQDLNTDSSFTRDATATDDGSDVSTYLWEQIGGDSEITFSNVNIANPTISADENGTYTIQLTVTDNAGNSASDTFKLTWNDKIIDLNSGWNLISVESLVGDAKFIGGQPTKTYKFVNGGYIDVDLNDLTPLEALFMYVGDNDVNVGINFKNMDSSITAEVDIVPGWNVISVPNTRDTNVIDSALNQLILGDNTGLTDVYSWDSGYATIQNNWSSDQLHAENGYWIQMSEVTDLTKYSQLVNPFPSLD